MKNPLVRTTIILPTDLQEWALQQAGLVSLGRRPNFSRFVSGLLEDARAAGRGRTERPERKKRP